MAPAGAPRLLAEKARLAAALGYKGREMTAEATALATLWAGYGSVLKVRVDVEGEDEPRRLVLKRIAPPPGDGASHRRKLRSYEVEAAFYRSDAPDYLRSKGAAVPACVAVDGDVNNGGGMEILLTDLTHESFPNRLRGGQRADIDAALTLLAKMHAAYFEKPLPPGLWEQACYWHLETRPDELRSMSDTRLQAAAAALDRRLRVSRGATLLHGDSKADNILTGDGLAALYDLQYTGAGLGARDVAYLLVSSCDARTLDRDETSLLDTYYDALLRSGVSPSFTRQALQDDFDVAVADYQRFMDGWGDWGNARWARTRTQEVLDRLESAMPSHGDWDGAIAKVFPV